MNNGPGSQRETCACGHTQRRPTWDAAPTWRWPWKRPSPGQCSIEAAHTIICERLHGNPSDGFQIVSAYAIDTADTIDFTIVRQLSWSGHMGDGRPDRGNRPGPLPSTSGGWLPRRPARFPHPPLRSPGLCAVHWSPPVLHHGMLVSQLPGQPLLPSAVPIAAVSRGCFGALWWPVEDISACCRVMQLPWRLLLCQRALHLTMISVPRRVRRRADLEGVSWAACLGLVLTPRWYSSCDVRESLRHSFSPHCVHFYLVSTHRVLIWRRAGASPRTGGLHRSRTTRTCGCS